MALSVTSISLELGFDVLKVFDGPTSASRLIAELSGSVFGVVPIMSTARMVFLAFMSDCSVEGSGFTVRARTQALATEHKLRPTGLWLAASCLVDRSCKGNQIGCLVQVTFVHTASGTVSVQLSYSKIGAASAPRFLPTRTTNG